MSRLNPSPPPKTWMEWNTHTGEARRHTDDSLRLRLLAIGVQWDTILTFLSEGEGSPPILSTRHSSYRRWTSEDNLYPWSLPTGAWGEVLNV